MQTALTTLAALALLAACGDSVAPQPQTETAAVPQAAADESIYQEAVMHEERTDADRARDAGRKPAEVLAFFAIEPGMTVLDLFSGGGYYTELLSRIVGPQGRVVAHTNQAYAQFVGEETNARYADNRLGNVELLQAENNELELPVDTFDAVMMILAYHDIYYVAPDEGWAKIDGPLLLAEIFAAIKPGGMLAIVDHRAAAGSPAESGNTLHRIDPQIVISELESAGFVLEAESDVLRNRADDHSLMMAAPEIRGKTDRFVLKFRKPG